MESLALNPVTHICDEKLYYELTHIGFHRRYVTKQYDRMQYN
jgi:hypothetical protein